MSRSKAKKRLVRKRRYVKSAERVKPSALAEAKKRPWPMREMLVAGDITAQQFEAGIEIVAGFDALTAVINLRGGAVSGRVVAQSVLAEISEAQARSAAIYLGYGQEVLKRFGVRARWIADFVRGDDPLQSGGLPLLADVLDLWHDHRDEWDPRLTATGKWDLTSGVTPKPQAVASPVSPTPPPSRAHAAAPTAAHRAVAPHSRRA
jgi:hypothetical protein